ncbi:MAG: hypothetical protein B6U78_00760 [Candidatus Aenigmarchaeota archaeon ex4484_224]|nr:MAG: hypothetical protein B6U78_00760 [Candidatus Aenigmarchaeota archaeon ex4484_224]
MEILKRLKEIIPPKVIKKVEFEGSEIIIYTDNQEFFQNYEETIMNAVSTLKKRIEVRATKDLLLDEEETKKKIKEIVDEDAGIKDIYFEKERSIVVIVAQKPGKVVGRKGEIFKKIKKETFWTPRIERLPSLESDIVLGIRKFLRKEIKFRKDFLNKVGKSIFSERKAERFWIRLIGLGGWREVGRSSILLETPKSKILIDAGISVGANNSNMFPIVNTKEFDYNEIDAVVISHAHLDHCGFLPVLYEYGYDGPWYATPPTIDLATLLWLDFIDVMQKSGNKPLFTAKGVKKAIKHSIAIDYKEVSDIAPDVRLTFFNAGHILGSALIHLHIGDGMHNILYALDQKYDKTNLLNPAHTKFKRVETLIIESTYGSKQDVMPPRPKVEEEFMNIINKTMERNGIVLIPSFSVERAQEVIAILLKNEFPYPIYIDGMIWDANGIFSAYPEYFNREMQERIYQGEDIFAHPSLKRIASKSDREKAWEDRPSIIISTSGMLIGGPVIEHLKKLAEDERNSLIFVGYQGEGTLGRRIQKGLREVPMKDEDSGKTYTLQIKMEVHTVDGLSAHSDRNQLLRYISRLTPRPQRVIVVHGEASKAIEFARTVKRILKIDAIAPMNLEAIRLR